MSIVRNIIYAKFYIQIVISLIQFQMSHSILLAQIFINVLIAAASSEGILINT
jgi:hypothetical protein